MLDPNIRELYIEALRPPQNYTFDRAVATTFTLDLLTLLSIPLSFVKFELKKKEDLLRDPISVLEALRRMEGRFRIFCQNGQIMAPNLPNFLFNYLEKMIIQVISPNLAGIFHPKIWVLRFVGKNKKDILYRFLCLSKNMSFDKSWDTILTLEGEVRGRLFARNRALSDFIMTLPGMTKKKLSRETIKDIEWIAEEIRHVDFKIPLQFDDFCFWPLGIPGYKKFPIQENYWRFLTVSPFLTNSMLGRLARKQSENILISRIESLKDLNQETLEKYKKVFFMDVAASVDDEESQDGSMKKAPDWYKTDLSGLHAKLYIAESAGDAFIWTGSANATSAAFNNNVEFLVGLKGKKSKVGIKPFLAQKEGVTSFRDLLIEYLPPYEAISEKERIKKKLEKLLENAQKQLSNADLKAVVSSLKNGNCYDLALIFPKRFVLQNAENIDGKCWPISLKSHLGKKLDFSGHLLTQKFQNISIEEITSLFAFELKTEFKAVKVSSSFVINLPIRGIPDNRDEMILQSIVSNQDNFLRYLLLLLYEGELSYFGAGIEEKIKGGEKWRENWIPWEEIPLFEEMVRAYSRHPEKIERISKLISDISKTKKGIKILPDGFKALWKTFQETKKIK